MDAAAAPSPPATLEGHLDETGPDRLRGWVWSPTAPERRVVVELVDAAGEAKVSAPARLARGDLQEAGKGDGRHGFELPLPQNLPGLLTLVARGGPEAADLVLAERVCGPAAPDTAGHARRIASPGGVTGWLDRVDGEALTGWCHLPQAFGPAVVLQVLENDRVLAEGVADRWRNDVEDLRQGDGRCGFRIPHAPTLYDGRPHRLELWAKDDGPVLIGPLELVLEGEPPPAPAPRVVQRPVEATPVISVVVNFFNMGREAARTLHSLSREFQVGVEALPYEVLCMDNGSEPPLTRAEVERFGPEFRLIRPSRVEASPCRALNEAMAQARGRWVAVMIDGAHVLSPGVLAEAHRALAAEPQAVVALRQWFIGGDQRWFSAVGYSPAMEDLLFARIDWPNDGYGLFDIAFPMYESPNSWLDGLSESNCLFMPADLYRRIGGFDPAFDTPGAGFANLDLFRRAAEAASAVVALVGEASFHQFHGGVTTNIGDAEKDARVRAYASRYERLRGEGFVNVAPSRIRLQGTIRAGAALTARQRPPAPARLGVTAHVRPRPANIQFDEEAQRYLQSAYVETGRHREARWRGAEVGVAPTDLTDIQEVLWRARPEVVVAAGVSPGLEGFVRSILPALDLPDARLVAAPLDGDAQADVGAAERVLVLLQPPGDAGLPVELIARFSRAVTLDSYLVVLGAALGQPWLGYSRSWVHRAIERFVSANPAFVIDRTLNRHFVTTSPAGFLRRTLDPLPLDRYDPALDDLAGL